MCIRDSPNTVVVLSAGASLETPWLKHCRTLVYGALGGQAGAGAMLDVLTGKVNPSGKLAETWVNAYADTPAKDNFAGQGRMVQYREGLYVGYRYYQTAGVPVAFPFGYGLSYTSFAYSNLQAASNGVTLTVTNTGASIPEEDLPVLFTPFYRVEKSRNKSTGGSGLGLYIAKTILDHHEIIHNMVNTENGVKFTAFLW